MAGVEISSQGDVVDAVQVPPPAVHSLCVNEVAVLHEPSSPDGFAAVDGTVG